MGMLEVHDGQGRVERLQMTRDQPLMFGSSPKADVVIGGEGIFPFHARLRWHTQKQHYRIETYPDVEYVLVNGRKMTATNLKMGDEIELGTHHVFVINEDDEADVAPPIQDDRTRVQEPPRAVATPPKERGKRHSRRPEPKRSVSAGPTVISAFDDIDEILDDLEPPKLKPEPRQSPSKSKAAEKPIRGWRRLFARKAAAPGQEEILTSPLVFGLFVTFVVLVLVGFALYVIIIRTSATRLYAQAVENLDDGDFRNAIARFDEFIKANPEDQRVSPARVHRAMANIRQFASAAGASWSLALEAERQMIDEVGREDSFKDSSSELDELILKTGESLADRAKVTGDERVLSEAEGALTLHASLAGSNAESLLKRSQLTPKIEAARAAVKKAGIRAVAFAEMDAAIKEGSSAKVYTIRDRLVATYIDQAHDAQLVARMTKANELIRKAVTFDTSTRPAETDPHIDPLGPPTSLVLRWLGIPEAAKAVDGPMVYALTESVAVGLEGATGTPLWQVPVGSASPFPPLTIPGGSSVLVFDTIHNELIRLEGKTGALIWRQALGERVTSPPLVLGNQIIQSAPSGRLYFIDLPTGELKGTVTLGIPLVTTPVSDESGQSLFIVADRDCLFVLKRDPLTCLVVEYLGHEVGSIAASPARVGRYLAIPENDSLENGRWRIFVIKEDGSTITPVQELPVVGWTWGTPSASGSVIWSSGDRGAVSAFSIGAYGEKNPFREIAKINPDNGPASPAFTSTRSERELWISSGRTGRYELDAEGGKLKTTWTLAGAGPALASPQLAGNLLVLTHQHVDGPGTALWGVEPKSGKPVWRTVLGSPWPAPIRVAADGQSIATFGLDGGPLVISKEQVVQGGFVSSNIPGPGTFRLPSNPVARIDGDGWTVIVPELRLSRLLVRVGDGPFQERKLPAAIGAVPLAFQGGLLLPGEDGRVYLLDPRTGESSAEPFIPPFDRARPTRWKRPVAMGSDAVGLVDDAGRVRKIALVNDPRPRLVAASERSLEKDINVDPAATKDALVVQTVDALTRSLSARDLSPIGAWPTKAPLAIPMVSTGDQVCVADSLGNLLLIGNDGQRLWESLIEGATLAGPPRFTPDVIWCLTREDQLISLSSRDGSTLSRLKLNKNPSGGPLPFGENLALPTGLGTLQLRDKPPTSPTNPPR